MRKIIILLTSVFLAFTSAASAEPFIPQDNGQVLEQLPNVSGANARELRHLRDALTQDPENLELALTLAYRYVDLGRAEADPRYNGYAQAALAPWWDQPEPPVEVLSVRAILRQRQHDFDAALKDLERVILRQENNAQAWLARAVILQVKGDYGNAMSNCLPLRKFASDLVAKSCVVSAGSVSGQAKQGYRLLREALEQAPDAPRALRLWDLTLLAEIAVRLGDEHGAEEHFQQALALDPRDPYLLGSYADFLLDTNRVKEVVTLLEDHTRIDGLLLRLALAEQRLGSPQLVAHLQNLQARFVANRVRGGSLHLRNEARFTLDLLRQPEYALGLATQNWAVQREPQDVRLLLECAVAANDAAAAAPVLKWLKRTKLEGAHIQRLVAQLSSDSTR